MLPLVISSPGAIAFQIGPVVIRWYGILMATAIVVGLWVGYRQAKRDGLPADDIISAGQWAILAGLAGARVYEVIFNWDYYGRYPSKIIAVWEGGLAIHGGILGGLIVGLRQRGWVEGVNYRFELRSTFGGPDKLKTAVQELLELKPDVILTGSTVETAAKSWPSPKSID